MPGIQSVCIMFFFLSFFSCSFSIFSDVLLSSFLVPQSKLLPLFAVWKRWGHVYRERCSIIFRIEKGIRGGHLHLFRQVSATSNVTSSQNQHKIYSIKRSLPPKPFFFLSTVRSNCSQTAIFRQHAKSKQFSLHLLRVRCKSRTNNDFHWNTWGGKRWEMRDAFENWNASRSYHGSLS